jgi:HlyD family secretion protein
MNITNRWVWLAGLLAVALAAGALYLATRSTSVDAVVVQQGPIVRTLQFSARVATLSRVDVGSTVTGRVLGVRVVEGARVRAGELLVELESVELRAAAEQALASQQQAQARLAGLRTSGRMATQASLAQADATLRASEAELARVRQLVAQGFVSESRLDDAQRAVEVARAQQNAAQAQSRANADAGTDVLQANAQLAQARAATSAANARLSQTLLLAPADARVLSRQVEPGQIVQPGKALLGLALAGPTQLIAQVDERFLDQLQAGQKASVLADAFAGRSFAATVLSLAPAVDAQRGAIEVKLAPAGEAPDFLREDMTLSVEVETARRERALVLPLAALRQQAQGKPMVLLAQDGRATERVVTLGLRTLDLAEVLQGLAAGDAVLLSSAVKAGDRVRARPVSSLSAAAVPPKSASGDAGSAMTNAIGR